MDYLLVFSARKRAEKVKQLLDKWEINYELRLPRGVIPKLMKELNLSRFDIGNSLKTLRQWRHTEEAIYRMKNPGYQSRERVIITKDVAFRNEMENYCKRNTLLRAAPNKEVIVCNTIIKALMDRLPRGGAGLIIGTPTAFCSSAIDNNNLLLTDNFEVAIILKATTNVYPKIVIGNGVSRFKAMLKGKHWKRNNSTNNCEVICDRVDSATYYGYVKELAEKYDIAKVVLMTSGVWSFCKSSQQKYKGLDLNFEKPSIELTSLYPNLHILAMTKDTKFDFGVRYLHRGINTLI